MDDTPVAISYMSVLAYNHQRQECFKIFNHMKKYPTEKYKVNTEVFFHMISCCFNKNEYKKAQDLFEEFLVSGEPISQQIGSSNNNN